MKTNKQQTGLYKEKVENTVERCFKHFVVYFLIITTALVGVPLDNLPKFIPGPVHLMIQEMFGIKDANAFQIKRVLKGSTDLSTNEVTSQPLGTTIDINKSFLMMTVSTSSDSHTVSDVMGVIDGPTDLLFSRFGGTAGVTVNWMVVEFKSGITVSQAITNVPDTGTGSTQKTITLPAAVARNKSFPIMTTLARRHNASTDEYNTFSIALGTAAMTDQVYIRRSETASAYVNEVTYQIVTFDKDVNVQHGGTTFGDSSLTAAVNLTTGGYSAVNMDKTMLFFTSMPQLSVNGTEIRTVDTAISFDRADASALNAIRRWRSSARPCSDPVS